jgi:hypothetical protein
MTQDLLSKMKRLPYVKDLHHSIPMSKWTAQITPSDREVS